MVSKIKSIHQFWTPLSETLWYAGFRTVFVLVVPQQLSWGCTFEVFAPQNVLNWVNLDPKQLCRRESMFVINIFNIFSGIRLLVDLVVVDQSCILVQH